MKSVAFAYHRPTSVDETVSLLVELGEDVSIVAGGQSLIPMMSLRLAQPSALLDLGGVPGLQSVRISGDEVVIGARVTHQDLAEHPLRDGTMDAFREAAAHIGHIPIRTRGTFGGSLAHADGKAEWCVLALALGGSVVVQGSNGRRLIDLDGYFIGPYQTMRGPDEVLIEARMRRAGGAALVEQATRHGDFAAAIVAAAIDIDASSGHVTRAGICIGGIRGTAVRMPSVEGILTGRAPTPEAIRGASRAAADELGAAEAGASYAVLIVEGLVDLAIGLAVRRAIESNGGQQ